MDNLKTTCPMRQSELIDHYFMEYRNHLLALAAFLDRLDRAAERDGEDDFRLVALRRALDELPKDGPDRVHAIQMILSDRDTTLLDVRDSQSAFGAPRTSTPDAER